MKLDDFDYKLPEGLIAAHPLPERSASRLMVLNRRTGEFVHRGFTDLKDYLRTGDLLVLNDTRVIPARLRGDKETGGRVELLLTERLPEEGQGGPSGLWRCMARPGKGLGPGVRLHFGSGVSGVVEGSEPEGFRRVRLVFPEGVGLEDVGEMPLPPYMEREAERSDTVRYQTVYARREGAVAAPTAGLHFTDDFLGEIVDLGVEVRYITLHTGPGTFLPVRTEDVRTHRMLPEAYEIPKDVFSSVRLAKIEKRRIIAVGTTTTRALEAASLSLDEPVLSGRTDLFIYPGYTFRVIDGLVTNFHLPRSTLIMLVSAFAGRENLLRAYEEAIRLEYRFYSYGDAMLII